MNALIVVAALSGVWDMGADGPFSQTVTTPNGDTLKITVQLQGDDGTTLTDPPATLGCKCRPTCQCVTGECGDEDCPSGIATVYTKDGCLPCDRLKREWKTDRVQYLNVDRSATARASAIERGIDAFPTLVLPDGTQKVGYDACHKALKEFVGPPVATETFDGYRYGSGTASDPYRNTPEPQSDDDYKRSRTVTRTESYPSNLLSVWKNPQRQTAIIKQGQIKSLQQVQGQVTCEGGSCTIRSNPSARVIRGRVFRYGVPGCATCR